MVKEKAENSKTKRSESEKKSVQPCNWEAFVQKNKCYENINVLLLLYIKGKQNSSNRKKIFWMHR